MDFYTPTVVISVKFVPISGDVKVVICSVLSQNLFFCMKGLIEVNIVQHWHLLASNYLII